MPFFSLLKVLLEAQDMAVRDHNVEFRSKLYIGKVFNIHSIGKCLPIGMLSSLSNKSLIPNWVCQCRLLVTACSSFQHAVSL